MSVWSQDAAWSMNAQAALPLYGLSEEAALEQINFSENATYRVTLQDGTRFILRLHRPAYRSLAEIRSELLWIEALRDAEAVRTPAIIPTLAGDRVAIFNGTPVGEQYAVLFSFQPGTAPDEDRLPQAFEELGTISARLHAQSAAWPLPPHFTRPVWDVEAAIGPQAHWGCWQDNERVGAAERALFSRADEKLRQELAAYGQPARRFGLIHGDMRLPNLLMDGGPACVIDFDDTGFSWHMYELGAALTFLEDHPEIDAIVAGWLRGYQRVRPLDPADIAILPSMAMLRRLLIMGWFSTHMHSAEARAMAPGYVAASMPLAEAYLAGRYLAAACPPVC